MAEYTIIGPEGERIIECSDGRCLHTSQMVSAELNRLAAEIAALEEAVRVLGAECRSSRALDKHMDERGAIGDGCRLMAAVDANRAATNSNPIAAEACKEKA